MSQTMARKSSKTSSLLPDGDKSPSSRNQSIYEKIPVFADIRDKTDGELYTHIQRFNACLGLVNHNNKGVGDMFIAASRSGIALRSYLFIDPLLSYC